jgi:hypothetical protein
LTSATQKEQQQGRAEKEEEEERENVLDDLKSSNMTLVSQLEAKRVARARLREQVKPTWLFGR